jgi:hypothetical protein
MWHRVSRCLDVSCLNKNAFLYHGDTVWCRFLECKRREEQGISSSVRCEWRRRLASSSERAEKTANFVCHCILNASGINFLCQSLNSSTQKLPRRSLLSECHVAARYMRKCKFVYFHKIYSLSCADFRVSHKCWTTFCVQRLYWILPDLPMNVENIVNLKYVPLSENVAFIAPIFTKYVVNSVAVSVNWNFINSMKM